MPHFNPLYPTYSPLIKVFLLALSAFFAKTEKWEESPIEGIKGTGPVFQPESRSNFPLSYTKMLKTPGA
ncbi:hypothetical protein HMPREF0322_01974 [Desulfitobacterium hafniense DP7]|uniref:Uncharacterized protein n=1 Tax=Desulfitobacterium hafniense DP7 TaxID=537010 RepID=G9XLY8_DESHA|nr:hypothetical protein HMPREF0322_01974 [Desulfitobacterium hafniense DP7]